MGLGHTATYRERTAKLAPTCLNPPPPPPGPHLSDRPFGSSDTKTETRSTSARRSSSLFWWIFPPTVNPIRLAKRRRMQVRSVRWIGCWCSGSGGEVGWVDGVYPAHAQLRSSAPLPARLFLPTHRVSSMISIPAGAGTCTAPQLIPALCLQDADRWLWRRYTPITTPPTP